MRDLKKLSIHVFVPAIHYFKDFRITQIGYHDFETIAPLNFFRIQDYFTIHFITKGEGTLFFNRKKYLLKENDVFFLPPDTPFKYVPNPNNKWAYAWIGIQGSLNEYFEKIGFSSKDPVYELKHPEPLRQFILEFFTTKNLENETENHYFSFFYEFMSFIETDRQEQLPFDETKACIEKAKALIRINYNNSLFKIEDVSKALYISHARLCVLFKKAKNITPKEYLINLRNKKAAELLANPFLSISEISSLVGYVNPLYFSTAFRKAFGVSPSEYRENLQQKNPND